MQILERADRAALFGFIKSARNAGAAVAFDPNSRPALWENCEAAARLAAAVARSVVSYPGAIVDRAEFAAQIGRDPELSD